MQDLHGISQIQEADDWIHFFNGQLAGYSPRAQEVIIQEPWNNSFVHVHLHLYNRLPFHDLHCLNGDVTLVVPQNCPLAEMQAQEVRTVVVVYGVTDVEGTNAED